VSTAELETALAHIRSTVAGEISLQASLNELKTREKAHSRDIETNEAYLPLNIKLATDLFEAGRLTKAEFVFHSAFHVVSLHEQYLFEGLYDKDLKEISARTEQIQREHGLKQDHYWLISDAPIEYQEEEDQKYNSVLIEKQTEVFRKFAPASLSALLQGQPGEFWNLYERGRRSVFEKEITWHQHLT
jgi:hypothetical protein